MICWFLDLNDLLGVNRTWLHKGLKSLKGISSDKSMQGWSGRGLGFISTGGNILLLDFFCFLMIRKNLLYVEKTLVSEMTLLSTEFTPVRHLRPVQSRVCLNLFSCLTRCVCSLKN